MIRHHEVCSGERTNKRRDLVAWSALKRGPQLFMRSAFIQLYDFVTGRPETVTNVMYELPISKLD